MKNTLCGYVRMENKVAKSSFTRSLQYLHEEHGVKEYFFLQGRMA